MRYRYFVDFRNGIAVFAKFSYGVALLGTPQLIKRYLASTFYYHDLCLLSYFDDFGNLKLKTYTRFWFTDYFTNLVNINCMSYVTLRLVQVNNEHGGIVIAVLFRISQPEYACCD